MIQKEWLSQFKSFGQFNDIHAKMCEKWEELAADISDSSTVHFCCAHGSEEDYRTTEYIRNCAEMANIRTKFLYIEDVEYNSDRKCFIDQDAEQIDILFKL